MRRTIAITALLATGCGVTTATAAPIPKGVAPVTTDVATAIVRPEYVRPTTTTTTTTVPPTTTTTEAPSTTTSSTTTSVVTSPTTSGRVSSASLSMTSVWRCIGYHESGNTPTENTGNGYYGEFQFLASTWDTVMRQMGISGYSAYPYAAAAPESLQLEAAEFLQRESGWGQWSTAPMCGV